MALLSSMLFNNTTQSFREQIDSLAKSMCVTRVFVKLKLHIQYVAYKGEKKSLHFVFQVHDSMSLIA